MSEQVDIDGRRRSFTVVGPENGGSRRALILVFHGSRQTADVHREFTGRQFDAIPGAVIAYLDGYRGNWNDARRESRFPARVDDVDDVAFVAAVVDRLEATHRIDPARVFGVGYSNGGQMVMRLLHEEHVPLAGAAVLSATMPTPESFLLPQGAPATPVPLLLIHGTADPISPFAGGGFRWWARAAFGVGGTMMSFDETAAYFAARHGLDAPSMRSESDGGNGTRLVRHDYRMPGLPPVVAIAVEGAGHTIPGATSAPRILGRTATTVSAASLAAETFGLT